MSGQPFDIGKARRDAEQRVHEYQVIEKVSDQLLQRPRDPLSMSSPRGDQITISSTWLAAALATARSDGFDEGRSIIQPLCDYANDHPQGWRAAMTEHVNEPTLLGILDTILDRA